MGADGDQRDDVQLSHGSIPMKGTWKRVQAASRAAPLRCASARRISARRISVESPITERSARLIMSQPASRFTATTLSQAPMPCRCWIAPEMPTAR